MLGHATARFGERVRGGHLFAVIGRALVALMAAGLLPATAVAQPRLRLTPVLELAQSYDDNLFPESPARQADFISRMGPRLVAAYGGRNLTIGAEYGQYGEFFGRHRPLNSTRARQDAAIEVGWSAGRALTLTGGVLYAQTTNARDLNFITALEAARVPARRFSTRESLSVRLGARTRVRADHAFDSELTSGFPAVDTHVATLLLERAFGPSETAGLGFSVREFAAGGSSTTSHVLALAWSRQVTPLARIEIKGGPRLSDGGRVGPEVSAAFRHRLRRGDVTLAYTQTETTAAGHLGRFTIEGVSATLHHQLFRGLRIGGGPGIFTSRRQRSEAIVYRANAELEWRLARRLALMTSHTWSLQQGTLEGPARPDIPHNTFSLRLVAGSARN